MSPSFQQASSRSLASAARRSSRSTSCRAGADAIPLSGSLVGALKRLRSLSWEESLRLNLARDLDAELAAVLDGVLARLMGRYPLSSRFVTQTRRFLSAVAEPGAPFE